MKNVSKKLTFFHFDYLVLMNKFKIFGIIGGVAVFLSIVGFWAKITHQAYADKVLTTGMWTLAVCAAVYVYVKFLSLKK